MVGLPALSRPVVSASLHKQCTKRNRRFMEEGRVETKETKDRRRTEEVYSVKFFLRNSSGFKIIPIRRGRTPVPRNIAKIPVFVLLFSCLSFDNLLSMQNSSQS